MRSERSVRPWTLGFWAIGVTVGLGATFAQSTLGSIQGTVVGSDGTPLPGARVYAALKAASQPTKAPPVLASFVQGATTAQSSIKNPASTFLLSKLPAGTYILCAQTAAPGWLDPCHWSASVSTITLAAGQNLTGQTLVMTKGAVVQFTIVDPGKLLPTAKASSAIPRDVELIAHASNAAYYNARISSITATGQTRQLTLPFDQPHTLIVRSQQFSLLDSTGTALPATGRTQPFQVASGSATPQFTYTVSGTAH